MVVRLAQSPQEGHRATPIRPRSREWRAGRGRRRLLPPPCGVVERGRCRRAPRCAGRSAATEVVRDARPRAKQDRVASHVGGRVGAPGAQRVERQRLRRGRPAGRRSRTWPRSGAPACPAPASCVRPPPRYLLARHTRSRHPPPSAPDCPAPACAALDRPATDSRRCLPARRAIARSARGSAAAGAPPASRCRHLAPARICRNCRLRVSRTRDGDGGCAERDRGTAPCSTPRRPVRRRDFQRRHAGRRPGPQRPRAPVVVDLPGVGSCADGTSACQAQHAAGAPPGRAFRRRTASPVEHCVRGRRRRRRFTMPVVERGRGWPGCRTAGSRSATISLGEGPRRTHGRQVPSSRSRCVEVDQTRLAAAGLNARASRSVAPPAPVVRPILARCVVTTLPPPSCLRQPPPLYAKPVICRNSGHLQLVIDAGDAERGAGSAAVSGTVAEHVGDPQPRRHSTCR